jgi:arylsulfatase A
MQLYNLAEDAAETRNLIDDEPEEVNVLLLLLNEYVRNGRSTPGEPLKNDRDVKFLPAGVSLPARD